MGGRAYLGGKGGSKMGKRMGRGSVSQGMEVWKSIQSILCVKKKQERKEEERKKSCL